MVTSTCSAVVTAGVESISVVYKLLLEVMRWTSAACDPNVTAISSTVATCGNFEILTVSNSPPMVKPELLDFLVTSGRSAFVILKSKVALFASPCSSTYSLPTITASLALPRLYFGTTASSLERSIDQ